MFNHLLMQIVYFLKEIMVLDWNYKYYKLCINGYDSFEY